MIGMSRSGSGAALLAAALALLAVLPLEASGVPPVCDADGLYAGTAMEPIAFDGTGSYDPDGVIIAYEWDFGDGAHGSGPQPVHAYDHAGTYTVLLTVIDDGGEGTQCTSQAIVESPSPPRPPLTWSLSDYQMQAEGQLPAFGPDLLAVPPGPDWLAGMTISRVASAVGDTPPQLTVQDGLILMGYDPPDGPRYIKIDFGRGYVRYSDRLRAYQPASGCTAVPDPVATSVFMNVAGGLGLPPSEFGPGLANTVNERSKPDNSTVETSCQIEKMVTRERVAANGYPVFDSRARIAVSHSGDCARLLLEWPRFQLRSGLAMRTRLAVVEDLAQRIWLAQSDSATALGPEIELYVRIGYAPTATGYVPVARAAFVDVGGQDGGQIEDVPLAGDPSDVRPRTTSADLLLHARFDPNRSVEIFDLYLPKAGRVRLAILDVAGREVGVVTDAHRPQGWHRLEWGARNPAGHRLPAGVYFARIAVEGRESKAKLLVIR